MRTTSPQGRGGGTPRHDHGKTSQPGSPPHDPNAFSGCHSHRLQHPQRPGRRRQMEWARRFRRSRGAPAPTRVLSKKIGVSLAEDTSDTPWALRWDMKGRKCVATSGSPPQGQPGRREFLFSPEISARWAPGNPQTCFELSGGDEDAPIRSACRQIGMSRREKTCAAAIEEKNQSKAFVHRNAVIPVQAASF